MSWDDFKPQGGTVTPTAPKGHITDALSHKGKVVAEEHADVKLPEGQPVATPLVATVGYEEAETVNLGDYNSRRISVFVSVPCAPDGKSIDNAFDQLQGFVRSKLEEGFKAPLPSQAPSKPVIHGQSSTPTPPPSNKPKKSGTPF